MGVLAGRYDSATDFPEDSRAKHGPDFVAERINSASIRKAKEIAQVATDADLTPSQLALLWLKDQPAVTAPIIGPRTMSHLDDALEIADRKLEPAIEARLNDIVPPGSAVADFFNTSGWMHQKLFLDE
jgi:aryl-alcohol dehydrogenase-like predicted oxidoreductase